MKTLFSVSFYALLMLAAPVYSSQYIDQARTYFEASEYKKAIKEINHVIGEIPEKQALVDARLLLASCYKEIGKTEDMISVLNSLIESGLEDVKGAYSAIMKELTSIEPEKYMPYLKTLAESTGVVSLKKLALERISEGASKMDRGSLEEYRNFILDRFKYEDDPEILNTLSESLSSLGGLTTQKTIEFYKKADEKLKKKFLLYISRMDDEDLVMALQSDQPSSGKLRAYVMWALAKMDPYRFAVTINGRLKFEDGQYFIRNRSEIYYLIKPTLEPVDDVRLRKYINRDLTVYGVELEEGFLFTEFYEAD